MSIGLIDIDSKIPNLSLMKISKYYKSLGEEVEFVKENKKYDKIFASCIFSQNKNVCEQLLNKYGDLIDIGGSGWDLKKTLPDEIEYGMPDYDLYSAEMIAGRIKGIMTKEKRLAKATEIVNAGLGYSSRGCIRNCGFCIVYPKEGKFRNNMEIKELLNPKSNVLILLDNNLTADPHCIDKLHEIRDRGLKLDLTQGLDVRLMDDDKANALKEIKNLRSLHYAWDLMEYENQVLEGINILSKYVKPYRHMCFTLVGYNTNFEEDLYRFKKLRELKIDPFVMVYNQKEDRKLKHFARWVNSRIYKSCSFDEYLPWIKEREKMNNTQLEFNIF